MKVINYYIINITSLNIPLFVIMGTIHYFKNNVFSFIIYIIENKFVMGINLNINSYKIDIP